MHSGRILGVDPGLNITGYGVLEASAAGPRLVEAGIVRAGQQGEMSRRLAAIWEGITELIRTFQPVALALEALYAHYEHPHTAILMGHVRGVICLAAGQAGIPVISYSATQVKRILTGSGRADKGQMQRAIQRELALERLPEPADVADALAVALCHYYMHLRPRAGLNR